MLALTARRRSEGQGNHARSCEVWWLEVWWLEVWWLEVWWLEVW